MSTVRLSFVEAAIAKAFRAVWRRTRSLSLFAHACVLDDAGAVLLVRPSGDAPWQLPGGAVRSGETAHTAILRILGAVFHGAVPNSGRLFAIYADLTTRVSGQHVVFLMRCNQGAEPIDVTKARFFDPSRLPENTDYAARRRIREVTGRMEPASAW